MQFEVYEAAVYREGEPQSKEVLPEVQKAEIPKLDASVALWLMLFVFGGGLLALYYAGINYFPEVSWQDSLTYLALMTIIGGSLLVAYSFLLFVPGAIWSKFLICDDQVGKVLTMDARPWEPCVLSVAKRILFPFALFMAFCHFLLYENYPIHSVPLGAAASLAAVSTLLYKDLKEGLECVARPGSAILATSALGRDRVFVGLSHSALLAVFLAKAFSLIPPNSIALWIAALLPGASVIRFVSQGRHEDREQPPTAESKVKLLPSSGGTKSVNTTEQGEVPDKRSVLCRSLLAFGAAALLSLMALWFFHRIYRSGVSQVLGNVPLGLLFVCTVVVIVTNLAVSVLFQTSRQSAFLASFLAALLLLGAGQLLATDTRATLPSKIMETFGFGGQSATLVVTERGGRILCREGIAVQFEELEPGTAAAASGSKEVPGSTTSAKEKPKEKGLLAQTAGLTILSRLGSEYLLRSEDQKRTIALPKGEVISWSTSPKEQELKVTNGCGSHKFSGL